jgi:hypothetical protein
MLSLKFFLLMIRKANNDEKFDQENIQHNRGNRGRRGQRGRGGRSKRGTAKRSPSQHALQRTPLKQNSGDDQEIQEFPGEHDDKILFKQDFVDLKTTATYTETGGKTYHHKSSQWTQHLVYILFVICQEILCCSSVKIVKCVCPHHQKYERQIENDSKSVYQHAQPVEKEVNLNKSYQKFNALF